MKVTGTEALGLELDNNVHTSREPGSEVNAGRERYAIDMSGGIHYVKRADGITLEDAYEHGLPDGVKLTVGGFFVPDDIVHEVLGDVIDGNILYAVGLERVA